MQTTLVRCAASTRGWQRVQPSWMSPGLTSHQQLDAGIAARQQAGRKALKKSKRPFDNYFRTQFRFSPRVGLAKLQTSGVMSSFDAAKMMTDPRQTWGAPWERTGGGGVPTRRKRHDVLEATPTAFGEDALDAALERFVDIRFAWDREDGVLCTSAVPVSLYSTTAHCRPYVSEVTAPPSLTSSTALTPHTGSNAALRRTDALDDAADGDIVMIAGTPVRIQRRTPLLRQKSGQPKRPPSHSSLGFSGVDAVPSLVLDVSHGPFLSAPSAPLMTSRWKGEHREAASVQRALQLLRQIRGVPAVALTPRASLLLLKALCSVEVEEPALAVSLAIAVGENYNGYSDTERLEVLRCLRRLALVRGLPDLATPDIDTVAVAAAAAAAAGGSMALPRLYTDAALTESLFAEYLRDAAPSLVGKIWGRLPEQSRHLLQHGYALDWFDLLRLAIAAGGPGGLPERLPNAITEAPYVAKLFFFHHTLGLTEETLRAMVVALRGAPAGRGTSSPTTAGNLHQRHTVPAAVGGDGGVHLGTLPPSPSANSAHFVDAVAEEVDRPLILWLCASLLVRIVAESLGDVVQHVGDLLHQHAALAAERAVEEEERRPDSADQHELFPSTESPAMQHHEICHPYPRFSSGAYQQIGCRKPKRVRVRLLPFEAFPRVAQCFSCPYASVTEKAEARERQRRGGVRPMRNAPHRRPTSTSALAATLGDGLAAPAAAGLSRPGRREVQSTFAAVLAESPQMVKQIERACAALTWSTAVLQFCKQLVSDLPAVAAPSMSVSSSFHPTSSAAPARRTAQQARDETGWARETLAMEVRHALCYRYVRSLVQQHMDALFTFLPWAEMELQLGPSLTGSAAADGAEEGFETEKDSETVTADALGALLDDAAEGPAQPMDEDNTADSSAPLSQAEQRARAMMEKLRECVEEFQVAVADILEAHERFFEAPADTTPPTF